METFTQPKKRRRRIDKPVAPNYGVYAVTCTATGEQYIGSASFMTQRFSRHRCDLRRGMHWNPRMQEAWAKHGEGAFTFTVLERLDSADRLKNAEQRWIDRACPAFNVHRCASSPLGVRPTEETRQRMSDAHKRYWEQPIADTHRGSLRQRQRNPNGTYA